jgi:hypothetical protein
MQCKENFTQAFNFHPYKMVVGQELSDLVMANRSRVAKCLIGILRDNNIILMTEEAHFHLSDFVNKQNFYYWAEEISITALSTISSMLTVRLFGVE